MCILFRLHLVFGGRVVNIEGCNFLIVIVKLVLKLFSLFNKVRDKYVTIIWARFIFI